MRSRRRRRRTTFTTQDNIFENTNKKNNTTTTTTTTTTSEENDEPTATKNDIFTINAEDSKQFKICNVLGGVDVTRFVSTKVRSFFASAIDDVVLSRGYLREAIMYENNMINGPLSDEDPFESYEDLQYTLNHELRNRMPSETTLDADLGYIDDRTDRRMEQFVNTVDYPHLGTKESDYQMILPLKQLFPSLLERKKNQTDNGEDLYTAIWFTSWGGSAIYYPSFLSLPPGSPLSLADAAGGGNYSFRDQVFVTPFQPEANSLKEAKFTDPYVDPGQVGLSIITAGVPFYFTGNFWGNTYDDTFIGTIGIDIPISSVSYILKNLEDTLVKGSFGILVNSNFSTIVISEFVVKRLYPERTGMEESRYIPFTYDRQNKTYLPSDTILQDLTNLTNADWKGLHQNFINVPRGDRDYIPSFNITLTGDNDPTEFYVMYERWKSLEDWILLVFAPISEVEQAIDVTLEPPLPSKHYSLILEKNKESSLYPVESVIKNKGNLDVRLSLRSAPTYMQIFLNCTDTCKNDTKPLVGHDDGYVLKAGENVSIHIKISASKCPGVSVGETLTTVIIFTFWDHDYLDCFLNEDLSLPLFIKDEICDGAYEITDIENGECICDVYAVRVGKVCVFKIILIFAPILVVIMITGSILLYIMYQRKQKLEASLSMKIAPDELKFGSPPQIIGEGSFGVVLLGEYRGTQVAVKRLPIFTQQNNGSSSIDKNDKKEKRRASISSTTTVRHGNLSERFRRRFSFQPTPSTNKGPKPARRKSRRISIDLFRNEFDFNPGIKDKSSPSPPQTELPLSPPQTELPLSPPQTELPPPLPQTELPPLPPRTESPPSPKSKRRRGRNSSVSRKVSMDVFKNECTFPPPNNNFVANGSSIQVGDSDNTIIFSRRFSADLSYFPNPENGFLDIEGAPINGLEGNEEGNSQEEDIATSSGGTKFSSVMSSDLTNILSTVGSDLSKKRNLSWTHHGETKERNNLLREIRILSKIRHPCIIAVMGAVVDTKYDPMLVMEYMEYGSLHDMIHNETFDFEGEILLSLLMDIVTGIQFLHNMKPELVHGDLKSHNVLVDSRLRAKVADFGFSLPEMKSILTAPKGTPYWMAPEILRGDSAKNKTSDVFALGIILYEIYSRKDPYYDENPNTVIRDIINTYSNNMSSSCRYDTDASDYDGWDESERSSIGFKRPPVPEAMTSVMSLVMRECLVETPEERPTIDEISSRLKRYSPKDVEPIGLYLKRRKQKVAGEERNFDLLLKMFPRHIAEALRDGNKVEPEHHESVTIFFSDIVGFTTLSSRLPPSKISDMLERLFDNFDSLSEKHGVHKVETVGDAWMGVTNCVRNQSKDHVKRVAEFSLDAMDFAAQTLIDEEQPELGFIKIRIGFHTGPVLSNVIGTSQPRYGLFGDCVNTAARMESNSLPSRIQCSEHAANILRQQAPDIGIERRGEIPIKGKENMTTYWITKEFVI